MQKRAHHAHAAHRRILLGVFTLALLLFVIVAVYAFFSDAFGLTTYTNILGNGGIVFQKPKFDTRAYDAKLLEMSHVASSSPWYYAFLAATSTPLDAQGNATTTDAKRPLWPVRAPYPLPGALLPFNRIVAYYGNFYSKGMGVLGEYPADDMLQKLQAAVAQWQAADPSTPVIPAIHYIVETAQAEKSKSGYYIARMPDSQIDHALELAARVNGLVFLDFQVGTSDVERELPMYEAYLSLPNVHVGIDPEFSMKSGVAPGRQIGTMDATDVNWVANYLAGLVKKNNLPPKVLIVHRFTEEMVTHAENITPLPEVQIVMDMDGWGSPQRKTNTYYHVISPEPVQFTGFKLFYKNDLKENPPRMLTPQEVLGLTPSPIYIQYQ
ncbi:MAG TPA: hypothetical protein VHD38_00530 [Candidatus Paceibacterota bacterium]|nr:hypothetical protein [Candidatus Paceibacterota bacterium]